MATKKGGYRLPTATTYVSDTFTGHKNRPTPSREPGTDYGCAYGSSVYAVEDGIVTRVDHSTSGAEGRRLSILLNDGQMVSMTHLSRILVTLHQKVRRGDLVAKSGASAWGREWGVGAHLHITLFPDGRHNYGTFNTLDFQKFVGSDNDAIAPASARVQWVADVQNAMNRWFNAGLVVDGILGAKTTAAIRVAQDRLKRSGFYKGKVDGLWGPLTNTALNAYKKNLAKKPSILYHKATVNDAKSIGNVQGLQKVARLYLSQKVDNKWGPKSATGLQRFLNQNYGGSLPAWLRKKYGYVGNDQWGPKMKAALQRANAANNRAL